MGASFSCNILTIRWRVLEDVNVKVRIFRTKKGGSSDEDKLQNHRRLRTVRLNYRIIFWLKRIFNAFGRQGFEKVYTMNLRR